jgi:triosephosphate isomerase (TIM)
MKRTPLIVANWKLHGQKAWIESFVKGFLGSRQRALQCEVVLCPPYVYLAQLQELLRTAAVSLGAQNLHSAEQGAFTGEVSAPMLLEFGCTHVVVGHSERRTLFGETDATVAAKFNAARQAGLVPILCIGENAGERDAGVTEVTVQKQLDAVLGLYGVAAFANAVIAYEPVWAIGTGNTATPAQAQAVHGFIRNYLASFSSEVAEKVQILYGGSVKADNADKLATERDIDGALVGGASLDASDFLAICAGFSE